MNKTYILIIVILILFSCKNSQRDSAISILEEWEQREILFPSASVFSIQGKDTVNCASQGEYKILSYIDSIGCTSCKLRLHDWKKLIKEFDLLYPNTVQYLFYFSSKKKMDICRILLANKFKYPICIDEQDSINILNRFPTNTAFQTFLLDKNNKIIAIGNPVYNQKIKELYLKIISGKDIVSSINSNGELQTDAVLDKSFINMGTFDWKQEQIVDIVLSNMGKELLKINEVSTSCGCITIEYSKEAIRPAKSLILKVRYKAEQPEHFDKTITIYCNAKDSPFRLKISGNAK